MNRPVLMVSAAMLAAGAYVMYRRQGQAADDGTEYLPDVGAAFEAAAQQAAEVISQFTGGGLKLTAMAQVTPGIAGNGNVQAFLKVIRRGEGTADAGGYSRLYGGAAFDGFADHPRRVITAGRWTSSAAGAYQFLSSTWDETRRIMGLSDFSPASQDLAAVGRIAARGALADVLAGRFESAIRKCAKEWASLPFSPYGQPTISMSTAAGVFAAAGGVIAA
jgi:muramidase (phage lysozyme)